MSNRKTIEFTKYRFVFIGLSILLLAGGLAGTLLQGGFNLGIDFRSGVSLQVELEEQNVAIEDVRQALESIDGVQVQELGDESLSRFSVRVQDDGEIEDFSNVMRTQITGLLSEDFGAVEVLGADYVEPRFAEDLALNATLLVIGAVALILLYLWFRFRIAYALSSVVALVHDIAFMVLFIGTFQIEVSSATIAAVLTIMGYSLNDTIVIFDRIRENEKLLKESSLKKIINVSITQSFSRTIITSLTTLLAVTSIFIFTTGQIQGFALNMIVGVIIGTYSSIFIASPTLLGLTGGKRREETAPKAESAVQPEGQNPAGEIAQPAMDSSALREQLRAQRQQKKKHK